MRNNFNNMKISIFLSETEFTLEQRKSLAELGGVIYVKSRGELPFDELLKLAEGSDIIAPDPDVFGGFEKARPVLMKLIESLPNLKGVCLTTTSFGWIDLDYCKKRGFPVSNVAGYSREAVAEHAIALLFCLAKRIIVTDRRTQKGQYKREAGRDLNGKTLGIIGLGNIGSRVAEIAMGIGMKVIAHNRSPKQMAGVEMKSFDEVLAQADAISIHVTHEDSNHHLIGRDQIEKMKNGVLIVNLVDRDLVDEAAMAEALKSGKVGAYAWEGMDLENTPLAGLENNIGLRGFGWYTKETLENLYRILVDNIIASAKGNPQNRIV